MNTTPPMIDRRKKRASTWGQERARHQERAMISRGPAWLQGCSGVNVWRLLEELRTRNGDNLGLSKNDECLKDRPGPTPAHASGKSVVHLLEAQKR